MGASESLPLSKQQQQRLQFPIVDEITTVNERVDGVDPIVRRLQTLKIAEPILKSPPPSSSESSLTDILVKKPSSSSSSSSSSISGNLDPKVLLELFSIYREWQEEKAKKISQKQEEIEIRIETADALAVKLLQRFNYSVSSMRTTAHNFAEVQPLQVEVGELKGRLTEVISNCDALCKRIATEGPEGLRLSVKPFSATRPEFKDQSLIQDTP